MPVIGSGKEKHEIILGISVTLQADYREKWTLSFPCQAKIMTISQQLCPKPEDANE